MRLTNKWVGKLLPTLIIFIFGLTPIIWFLGKGEVLINGVDTNFPLDPLSWFLKRFFVWNSTINTGVDFSSSTAGLFFHLIQVIPAQLGLAPQKVQIISLIFWFLSIVFSAYILAKVLFKGNFPVQCLFVILYSFNVYLFNTWENIKVSNLSLIAALPLGLAIFLALNERSITRAKAAFYSALVGIVLSGSGINPSYFLTFYFILFIFLLSFFIVHWWQKRIISDVLNFLIICAVILAVNLFWILPTSNFILQNVPTSGTIYKLGLTNWIDSLSENTSLFNVTRLQGAWDWYPIDEKTKLPLYIPYSLNYFHRLPFITFSILIPSLALLSFLFFKREQSLLYISFGILAILGIFLTAGTHLPSGAIYKLLVDYLPFFTIFRSPWYIFSPMIILAFAGLVCLLFYNLSQLFQKYGFKGGTVLIWLGILILVVGNFLYNYPLVTGKIFRPDKKDGFYINFPDYVFEARDWLKTKEDGRIIGYPSDEIENFKWGYRGIDSIIGLISGRELLFLPLSYLDPKPVSLIAELYKSIKKGQMEATWNLVSKLNIGTIFEKQDQQSLAPEIRGNLSSLQNTKFGDWYFYQVPSNYYVPKIYPAKKLILGYPPQKQTQALTILSSEEVMVNAQDSIIKQIPGIAKLSSQVILTSNSQAEELDNFLSSLPILDIRLISRDLSKVNFQLDVLKDDVFEPVLEKYGLSAFGIDKAKNLEVVVDGKEEIWSVGRETDTYLFFKPLKLLAGRHQITLRLENKNLIAPGGDFEGELVFKQTGEGIFEILQDEKGKYLSIFHKKKTPPDPSADFTVVPFDPLGYYLIQLRYRQIYGNLGNLVILQGNKDTLVKAQAESLPSYPDWNNFSFYFSPVATPSELKIALVAPHIEDPLGTRILYDDLSVYQVFTNKLLFLNKTEEQFLSTPRVEFKKLSPVSYEVNVENGNIPHVLVFSENYSPDWELTVTDPAGKKLDIKPLHFSANVYANSWYLSNTPSNYKAKIFYKPQGLFWLGLTVASGSLVITALVFLKSLVSMKTKRGIL